MAYPTTFRDQASSTMAGKTKRGGHDIGPRAEESTAVACGRSRPHRARRRSATVRGQLDWPKMGEPRTFAREGTLQEHFQAQFLTLGCAPDALTCAASRYES